MPVLEPGVPLVTSEPIVQIDNRLKPGTYEFHLVCVDEGGNESNTAKVAVTVQRAIVVEPTPPVFDPTDRFSDRFTDVRVRDRVVLADAVRLPGGVVTGRTIPFRRGGGR